MSTMLNGGLSHKEEEDFGNILPIKQQVESYLSWYCSETFTLDWYVMSSVEHFDGLMQDCGEWLYYYPSGVTAVLGQAIDLLFALIIVIEPTWNKDNGVFNENMTLYKRYESFTFWLNCIYTGAFTNIIWYGYIIITIVFCGMYYICLLYFQQQLTLASVEVRTWMSNYIL